MLAKCPEAQRLQYAVNRSLRKTKQDTLAPHTKEQFQNILYKFNMGNDGHLFNVPLPVSAPIRASVGYNHPKNLF